MTHSQIAVIVAVIAVATAGAAPGGGGGGKPAEREPLSSKLSRMGKKELMDLGNQLEKEGLALYKKAKELVKGDEKQKAEAKRLDAVNRQRFIKAAEAFEEVWTRFPTDKLAGLAGVSSGQNYIRAKQFDKAAKLLDQVAADNNLAGVLRAQAMFWSAFGMEQMATTQEKPDEKAMKAIFDRYRKITSEYPKEKWAKFARGRLASQRFQKFHEKE